MKVFSGTSNLPLAEKIAIKLGLKVSPIETHVFPDGEKRIRVEQKVVDEDVIVVQSTGIPTDQNYMELFFILDALKRSGAKKLVAVVPYLGYQRQDHVFRSGEAVSLSVVIRMLEVAGASNVITFDLHSIKIPEFFKIPMDHLSALPIFAEKIKALIKSGAGNDLFGSKQHFSISDMLLVSPDMGGVRRIKILSKLLNGVAYASIEKNRDLLSGKIASKDINLPDGFDLNGKTAIIVDDMISSGNTICEAAKLLQAKGVKHIFVLATHAVFSEKATEILQKAEIDKIFVTDTILVPREKKFEKLEIISVAEEIVKEIKGA